MAEAHASREREAASLSVLWRLKDFIRPRLFWFLFAMALSVLFVCLQLAIPYVFGRGIDAVQRAVEERPENGINLWRDVVLNRYSLVLALVILGLCLARFLMQVVRAHFRQHVLTDLRCAFYDAVQYLSLDDHTTMSTGELISRGTRDVNRLRRFFAGALFGAVNLVVTVAGVIVIMVQQHWTLAVASLWPLPLAAYLLIRFSTKLRPMWRQVSDSYANVTTVLQENIAGMRVVKAFGRGDDEIRKFRDAARRYRTLSIDTVWYWAGRIPIATFSVGLSIPLVVGYGGYLIGQDVITNGELIMAIMYLMGLSNRVRMIGRLVNIVQMAAASSERIFGILDHRPKVREHSDAGPMPEGDGRVEFRNVHFAHGDGTPTLKDITFTVEPGQMVAVVGRTGSGKTTLVSLLLRFRDPTSGTVLIDGMPVQDIRLRDLRRHIGLIAQEPFLFSTTVAENIAYGRPDADEEAVREWAEAAQAHEFIDRLPQGYSTIVGERGVTLSGGQRQRVAIARAFMTDPRILIMDDATASVDSATEKLIHEAMFDVAEGRTTFLIAHRLSTVRQADLIILLQDGCVAEAGTHEELLARDGAYTALFRPQLIGSADSEQHQNERPNA